jgi:hypothetical protein
VNLIGHQMPLLDPALLLLGQLSEYLPKAFPQLDVRWNSICVCFGGSRSGVSSMDSLGIPPETSNFYCLPGRAGGTPIVLEGPEIP